VGLKYEPLRQSPSALLFWCPLSFRRGRIYCGFSGWLVYVEIHDGFAVGNIRTGLFTVFVIGGSEGAINFTSPIVL